MEFQRMSKFDRSPIYRIVVAQVFVALFASVLCLLISGSAAISALMAGVVCIIPGLYVLLQSVRPVAVGATGMSYVLKGEIGKFILAACLFAGVFVFYKQLNVMAFFGMFVVLQLVYAVLPVIEARRVMSLPHQG